MIPLVSEAQAGNTPTWQTWRVVPAAGQLLDQAKMHALLNQGMLGWNDHALCGVFLGHAAASQRALCHAATDCSKCASELLSVSRNHRHPVQLRHESRVEYALHSTPTATQSVEIADFRRQRKYAAVMAAWQVYDHSYQMKNHV